MPVHIRSVGRCIGLIGRASIRRSAISAVVVAVLVQAGSAGAAPIRGKCGRATASRLIRRAFRRRADEP